MSSSTHGFASPSETDMRPLADETDELPPAGRPQWRLVGSALTHDYAALMGLIVIVLLIVFAVIGPYFASSPTQIQMARLVNGSMHFAPFPPSPQNFFGTDQLGRDIFSRVLYGLRTSLEIGLLVRGLTIIAGTILGIIAGYTGGIADSAIMRTVDILYAFPVILLAMAITAVTGPGFNTIVLALVIVSWPDVARLTRSQALSLRQAPYAEAARALGASTTHIMSHHIVPNMLDTVVVAFSIGVPGAIMYEAGLSFFGFGIQPPDPSLGSIIADGRGYITSAWWYPLFPGLVLVLITVSFNLLGDGLARALDPRRRA